MVSTENEHPFLFCDEMGVQLLINSLKSEVDKGFVKKARISQDKSEVCQQRSYFSTILFIYQLVFELCCEEFTVEAGDMAYGDMFRAFHLAGAGIGAGTESQLVHLGHHGFRTACAFNLALRQ